MTDLVFQSLPKPPAVANATAEAALVRAEADEYATRTRQQATRILEEAQQHANEIKEQSDKRERHGAFIDRILPRIAMIGAVTLTALGEYQLAHLTGFPGVVAAMLPTTLDTYVIAAIRKRRDVLLALLMAIAANALYHLAAKNLFGTDGHGHAAWWLVVGVASIAPTVVWRIHQISHPKPARATQPIVAEPAPETADEAVQQPVAQAPETVDEPVADAVAEPVADTVETAPETVAETPTDQRETAPVKRVAKPRKRARATRPNQPSQLMPLDAQLKVVEKIVEEWRGDDDPPLQDIADALGASKSTASRRLSEFKTKSA